MKLALDFGTCNSSVVRLNPATGAAENVRMEGVSRRFVSKAGGGAERADWVVPSMIHYGEGEALSIGEQVRGAGLADHPHTLRWTKLDILNGKKRSVRLDAQRVVGAETAAAELVRNLLAYASGSGGERIEEVVVTVPVEAYDPYVHWLRDAAAAGGATVRVIDEATACILGYKEAVQSGEVYAVCDFGGGTFDVAIVKVNLDSAERKCSVLGRAGAELGGIKVDRWMVEEMLEAKALTQEDLREVGIPLLDAIEQAKMDLSDGETSVTINQRNRVHNRLINHEFTRDGLAKLLRRKGFGEAIADTVTRALEAARDLGARLSDVKGVFLVGGTSLLLGVRDEVARHFPKTPIHGGNPFLAIAAGACRFAGGEVDFRLVHDYGVMSFDRNAMADAFVPIVPKGTAYPTPKPVVWELGAAAYESQALEMIVCERAEMCEVETNLHVGADGRVEVVQKTGQAQERIRKLNPKATRFLRPVPPARLDEKGRFIVGFRVDENKFLRISVVDQKDGNASFVQTAEGEKLPLPLKAYPLARLG